ncbi:MAG: PAS domain-containing protein [Candidatus Kapabacteria bacterium]|nr:PAS domain-containing protein [Candidatus Kapabacteria bacterium]
MKDLKINRQELKAIENSTRQLLKINESIDFPTVGIGASAGGLEALEQFFSNMPNDCGIAFVIILHLDPTQVGIMPELLQRLTAMKVVQVTDRMQVQPNNVYVIPPNRSMSLLNGALHLFEPIETRGLRLPIDFFFRSLAEDQQEKSIGIILSGMGSDGSLGLKAIKEKNGLALVQSLASAKFGGMPHSASDAVIADIIAPANELPAKLIACLKFLPVDNKDTDYEGRYQSNLEKVIILLRNQTGHDFSLYKKNTLFRRIERRMSVHQINRIVNYVRYLRENPIELEILFKELLIGVTSFFRDKAVWEKLQGEVIPDLLNRLPKDYLVRAWIPGCSTGEEAYSLAIVFKETLENLTEFKNITLQIFASDLDNEAIEKARKGFYPLNIAADISPERLNRYFIHENNGFRISPQIRETVVFAHQNLIKDPPFTKLDILSCRNLLIYIEQDLQKKIMKLFHYSLNPGGLLILGSAETIGQANDIFSAIDLKQKLYKRSPSYNKAELTDFPSSFSNKKINKSEEKMPETNTDNIQTLAEQILLQHFAPASVIVNASGDIIYITGRTGKYLEPAAGKANMNIYSMAREGLRHELPAAMRQAGKNFDPIVLNKLKVGTNGGVQYINVTVQQIEKPVPIKGSFIIVFSDLTAISEAPDSKLKKSDKTSFSKIRELEIELQRSNEEMQSMREEMQTSQEELKSTNEELQSTNEELQSTNEELTTSKEEMQSLNEELQTVNIELQSRVTEYLQAENDMKNLLNSTDIATLFLDKELNIRRFTDKLTKIFKIRQTDIGRPFTDMVSILDFPEMENTVKGVLQTLIFTEMPVSTSNGTWYNVRIMPYRTYDDRIDGVVITFIDISSYKFQVKG